MICPLRAGEFGFSQEILSKLLKFRIFLEFFFLRVLLIIILIITIDFCHSPKLHICHSIVDAYYIVIKTQRIQAKVASFTKEIDLIFLNDFILELTPTL